MSVSKLEDQISLIRSHLHLRRFNEETLRILESILVSKDVKSLLETRNQLKKLLRSESFNVFREIAETTVQYKLLVFEFFVRAFILVADVESCLALRYEAFLLREKNAVNEKWLQVSSEEWLSFARDSLENGFYSNSVKGCEIALSCIQANNDIYSKSSISLDKGQIIEEIKKLKDAAITFVASHSVRAQAAEHLKNKTIQEKKRKHDTFPAEPTQCIAASSRFRNGIKNRNMQRLRQLQSRPLENL
ncbi:hypothetical protein ACHQM5_027409 [Ranunculus cassubicifolius]